MTDGQQLALDEMALIQRENPEVFEVIATTSEPQDRLRVKISVHIGPVDSKPGGLRLRERESFVIWIPPDYPFSAPHISVTHHRFQGFPHVCWRTSLCVYQSEQVEWNPADGMFGFFDRVSLWLHRASQNEMDPIEGPLEPPHYVTDSKEPPLVVRANSPAAPGTQWIGWACLNNSNRVRELNSWSAFAAPLPTDCQIVPAIFVAKPFPMEFPRKGEDIFSQLQSCGVDRNVVLALLTLSALFTPEGETGLIVVGLPMRRGLDGSPRQHIAAWVVSAETLRSMRMTIPVGTDTNEVRGLRGALAEAVFNVISSADIEWCRIYEDREEIVVRRDLNRPLAWFLGKRILILGCGALGSWAAEVIARARPARLDFVDKGVVKPGILARQNYVANDIGASKATALAKRIKEVCPDCSVTPYLEDANANIERRIGDLREYDLVLDCTASRIVSMKIESKWSAIGFHFPHFSSLIINAKADCAIGVHIPSGSPEGPWSAYVRLKNCITRDGGHQRLVNAFYGQKAIEDLFQPEPGCSDPTFSGSTADVMGLISGSLNLLGRELQSDVRVFGFSSVMPELRASSAYCEVFELPKVRALAVGGYKVLISEAVFNHARSFVRQNQRLRAATYETGGLLWGYWDTAAKTLVVLDASGPPPDSVHQPAHFQCGSVGTTEEHIKRTKATIGACGFIGMWHTHPNVPPEQSVEDMVGMTQMVARTDQNGRRSLMLIFGREDGEGSVGVYVYEGRPMKSMEIISVDAGFLALPTPVA